MNAQLTPEALEVLQNRALIREIFSHYGLDRINPDDLDRLREAATMVEQAPSETIAGASSATADSLRKVARLLDQALTTPA